MGLFGVFVSILWKVIAFCFLYAFICTGVDTVIWFFKCLAVGKYNYYTTKVQHKFEQKVSIPYTRNSDFTNQIIDISSLSIITPKLIARIDVMTGEIETQKAWKHRGIFEKFIHPWNMGMAKSKVTKKKTEKVEKSFLYSQSLINTLNMYYPNWQELNPELIEILQKDKIIAEEIVIFFLRSFRH